MKKGTVLSGVCLVVFGLTLGLTLAFTQPAAAIWQCSYQCLYAHECRPDGPDCGPDLQLYFRALCSGGPLNCSGISYWSDGICCVELP